MSTDAVSGPSVAAPPSAGALAGVDPEIAIGAAAMKLEDGQLDSAKGRAKKLSSDRDAALEKARQAIAEARDDNEDGGFFGGWSDKLKTVAQVATAVAAGAAIVSGVGAPAGALLLVGLGLTGAGIGMKMAHADVDLGNVKLFGANIDVKLSDVCELAGAACATGAAAAAGSSAAQGTATATRTAEIASKTARVANGAAALALGGAAYFTVKAANANGAAADHEADAHMDNAHADDAKAGFEGQVDSLRAAMETRSRIAEALGNILEQHREQNTALTEGIRA